MWEMDAWMHVIANNQDVVMAIYGAVVDSGSASGPYSFSLKYYSIRLFTFRYIVVGY